MPGERTLYRQIQVVLDYVQAGNHSNFESLKEYIYSRSPTNFIYYYRNKETDKITFNYSRKSIGRVIQLCLDLELLRSGSLTATEKGSSATDPRRFPLIIGKSVRDLFNTKHITLDLIHKAIKEIVANVDMRPPTADSLWEYLETFATDIELDEFKRYMNLLGQCNILQMSQRRIYLPITNLEL
jgi:hypothetical protein